MAIQVFLDGAPIDVSKDELFKMARRGEIGPDTEIIAGETRTTAGKVNGIQFGSPPLPEDDNNECGNCGMPLETDTEFCPECGMATDPHEREWQSFRGKPFILSREFKFRYIVYGAVLIFCFLLFWGNRSASNDPEYRVKQEQKQQEKEESRNLNRLEYRAVNKAKEKISDSLVSPKSAKFGRIKAEHSRSTGKWRISGHVDSQNVFGAMIRKDFSIIIDPDEIR